MAVATLLATVDIVPALNQTGEEISISLETTGRVMKSVPSWHLWYLNKLLTEIIDTRSSPVHFECRFKPRNEATLAMMKETT